MRLALADPPRPWQPQWQRAMQRIIGRWVVPTAADPQRPAIRLNRYPHEVIGLAIYPGGRRYLSWVWPVRIVGLTLTREQFDRGARELLDTEGGDHAE